MERAMTTDSSNNSNSRKDKHNRNNSLDCSNSSKSTTTEIVGLSDAAKRAKQQVINLNGKEIDMRSARDKLEYILHYGFEEVGGAARMILWMDEHYDEFIKIYLKLIPQQVVADINHAWTIQAPIVPQSLKDISSIEHTRDPIVIEGEINELVERNTPIKKSPTGKTT